MNLHPNTFIKTIDEFGSFENLKTAWEMRDEKFDRIVLFLGESKHKIKKKAEQATCKISIEVLS